MLGGLTGRGEHSGTASRCMYRTNKVLRNKPDGGRGISRSDRAESPWCRRFHAEPAATQITMDLSVRLCPLAMVYGACSWKVFGYASRKIQSLVHEVVNAVNRGQQNGPLSTALIGQSPPGDGRDYGSFTTNVTSTTLPVCCKQPTTRTRLLHCNFCNHPWQRCPCFFSS